jgi:hypothetical protein
MGSLSLTDGLRQPTSPMSTIFTRSLTLEGRNHGFEDAPRNMSPVTLQLNRAGHAGPTWSHQRLPSDPVLPTQPKIEIYRQHSRARRRSSVFVENKNDFLLGDGMSDDMDASVVDNSEKPQMVAIERILLDSPTNRHEAPFQTRDSGTTLPHESRSSSVQTNIHSERNSELESQMPDIEHGGRYKEDMSNRPELPPPGPLLVSAPESSFKSFSSPIKPQTTLFSSPDQEEAPFGKDWARIKKLRTDIWGMRSRMHEMRRVVKEKQQAKSVADNKYFQYMRLRGLGMSPGDKDISEQKTMEELFQSCEKARDEYGPLEDDCTLLENHIGSQELELQRLEEKFYERPFEPPPSQTEGLGSPQPSPTVSLYSGSDASQEFHPLVTKYLSRVGDVEILKERLDEHLEERYILEDEKAVRQGLGYDLAEPAQKWLDNYSITETLLMNQLEEAELEAANLRQNCFSRGLVDQEGNPTDLESQEQRYFADDVGPEKERSEYVKYPILIPRPGSRLQLKYPVSDSEASPDDSGNLVSHWLLQQLRSSPLDVNLLARISESLFDYINREKWQFDVMKYWYKDSTKTGESQHPITSSLIMSSNPPTSGYPSTLSSIKRENHEWGMSFQTMPLILGKFGGNAIATSDPFRLLRSSKYGKRATKSV